MKKIILYSVFWLNCFVLNAQYWTKQHFNVENGLPNNYTFAVTKFQDEIYVATDGGLVTFDGTHFKIQNKKEIRYPVSLLNAHDSILYIGSWLDGIVTTNGNNIKHIYPDRINRILKTNNKHLVYNTYQREALLRIKYGHQVDTIVDLQNTNPNRRIAIDDTSIYVAEKEFIYVYNWLGKKQYEFPHQTTATIETLFAIDNLLFIGDQKGNLSWFSKKGATKKLSHHFEKIAAIKKMIPYKKQQFLIQLNHRAEQNSLCLLTFDNEYSKITDITPILTINNGISDVFVDKETIYVASYGNGLYKLFPSLIKSYHKNEHQLTIPKFIYENDKGNMIFATENISYLLKENDSFIQQKNPYRLNDIFQFNGKHYFSSHANLYDSRAEKIANTRMNAILYASKNDTIFYSKYWLSRYHNGEREDIHCIHYKKKDKKINTGILFGQNIYVGTQNGIKLFQKNNADVWVEEQDSLLQNYFKQRVIRKIISQQQKLIITTPYEIYSYDGLQISSLQFTTEDIFINDVFIDTQNRIYCGTNKGFWVLTDNFNYHFTTQNGSNSDNIYSFYQDSKGIIWMISGNGIMKFNPKLLDVTLPPSMEIVQKNIHNDHVSIQVQSRTRNFPEAVTIQYNINNSEWRNLPSKNLELSSLKPGDYNIAFRGKQINSEWSLPEKTQFIIYPKWYQITAIKISIFSTITLLLLGFLWYRLRSIKHRNETLSNEIERRIFLEHKVENLREEVARDFHDEIGNKIASVIGLSNNLKHAEKITSPKIDKIADLSKEVYHTAKDFVWSLNPKNNNIESLCKYLRDYGENFFDLFDTIDFLYLEIDIAPIEISYVKSRNIILAYKEILGNILKHAHATKVVFKAYWEEPIFTIQIQDNGNSFDPSKTYNGNGLKNIQKRMETIHASMIINTSNGVTYTFAMNLKDEKN